MRVKLGAGERLELGKDNRLARVVSGSVEAYAVTAGDASFRQFYLMTLGAGEAAFPAMDEFGEIAVVLSAAEDAELEETAFGDEPPETLKPLMQSWFKNLGEIPWLRLLADKGDDILRSWTARCWRRPTGMARSWRRSPRASRFSRCSSAWSSVPRTSGSPGA